MDMILRGADDNVDGTNGSYKGHGNDDDDEDG